MGSIPNGSAPLQACARQIVYSCFRAALGRRKFISFFHLVNNWYSYVIPNF
jgi:hypothetical protein